MTFIRRGQSPLEVEVTITVYVVIAQANHQQVFELRCPAHTTIAAAIAMAGFTAPVAGAVGVDGRCQPLDYPLCDHDRVELYRPLQCSPTEARRLRAAVQNKRLQPS